MTWQVSGGPSPEYRVPTGPKTAEVEIAQARDLDVDCLPLRLSRTDLDARHECSGRTLGLAASSFAAVSARNLVDPAAVDLLRIEFQLQLFADHASKEATQECCCQPVSFIIAEIVIPVGD